MHVRRGDEVVVIRGKEKGKRGKVLKILSPKFRAVVERVNMVKKHLKPSQTRSEGGIVEQEGSVALSNLALWCAKCTAGRRSRLEKSESKDLKRVCVKCGSALDAA